MPISLTMPALSPTMEEGTLAKWIKKEGDTVEAGDVIAEIETDKATMEFEAVDEGTIGKILVQEGTEGVAVNAPIAILLEEGEDNSALDGFEPGSAANDQPAAKTEDKPASESASKQDTKADSAASKASQTQSSSGERIFASPLARRLAEQKGVDLSQVKGSGPRGRIVKSDIEGFDGKAQPAKTDSAAPKAAASPSKPSSASVSGGVDAKALADKLGMAYKEHPNNNIRKVTARRLMESKQTVPHFYLTIECNIDGLLATRKEINAKANGEYKVSVNDFIVKACANALKAYPAANVAWTEDAILEFEHADVSVAVATENGLITPIVKKAEQKGLRQISEEIKDLAGRAREGKLAPEEFQGGTFTVSNLGMYGIDEFGAIINPPQSCILAVGAGQQKPYVEDGKVKIGTFMKATLSTDHRTVDGAVGAEFLQFVKKYIEDPISMLV